MADDRNPLACGFLRPRIKKVLPVIDLAGLESGSFSTGWKGIPRVERSHADRGLGKVPTLRKSCNLAQTQPRDVFGKGTRHRLNGHMESHPGAGLGILNKGPLACAPARAHAHGRIDLFDQTVVDLPRIPHIQHCES